MASRLSNQLAWASSSLPRRAHYFRVKVQLAWASFNCPKMAFSIKSHDGEGGLRGWKVQHLRKLREKKKKKEEETKPRHYRITTVIIPYVVSCSVFSV